MNLEGKHKYGMIIRKRLLMIGIIMREVVFVRPFFQGPNGLIWIY